MTGATPTITYLSYNFSAGSRPTLAARLSICGSCAVGERRVLIHGEVAHHLACRGQMRDARPGELAEARRALAHGRAIGVGARVRSRPNLEQERDLAALAGRLDGTVTAYRQPWSEMWAAPELLAIDLSRAQLREGGRARPPARG